MLIGVTLGLLTLIWGTTWSVIQIGLQGIPPFSGVAIRFSIAAVLLLGLTWLRGVSFGSGRHERMLWLVNGFLAFSISYGVVYWIEQWVPSSLAAVLFATYPLFVAILAHLMIPAERLHLREIVGILIGFGGVGVIFSTDFDRLGGEGIALAAGVMLISPLVSAVASVVVKRWGQGVHPFSLTAVPMAIAGVVMGVLALTVERQRTFDWSGVAVAALLYLTILGTIVTFTLYYWLLSHLQVKRLALLTYLIPMVAVAIGVMRGEPLTLRILAGSILVVIGVWLAMRRRS